MSHLLVSNARIKRLTSETWMSQSVILCYEFGRTQILYYVEKNWGPCGGMSILHMATSQRREGEEGRDLPDQCKTKYRKQQQYV